MAQLCEMRDIRTAGKGKEKEKFHPKSFHLLRTLAFQHSVMRQTDLHCLKDECWTFVTVSKIKSTE